MSFPFLSILYQGGQDHGSATGTVLDLVILAVFSLVN